MKRIELVALLVATVVAAYPSRAVAHEGNFDPAVIHACIGGVNGQTRVVGVNGSCRNDEAPLHWSIVGETGPRGAQGPPGVPGPAATNPDPPCFDNANRYVDCGNGTITDTVTGLVWLKTPPRFLAYSYDRANQWAAQLADGQEGLTDHSKAGDWRLPTKAEWEATVKRAIALGCQPNGPILTNDVGTGCWGNGPSTMPAHINNYMWTSTADEFDGRKAWTIWIDGGGEGPWAVDPKTDGAWFVSHAVRSGAR